MSLTKYADKFSYTYSGGNQRKLVIAMGLIGNPQILLLDEPLKGIDPATRQFLLNFLKNFSKNKKNTSIILITQFVNETKVLSNKIAIMKKGNLKAFCGL